VLGVRQVFARDGAGNRSLCQTSVCTEVVAMLNTLLWALVVALLLFWLIGLSVNWGDWLWSFFVLAVVILLINLFTGRRAVA